MRRSMADMLVIVEDMRPLWYGSRLFCGTERGPGASESPKIRAICAGGRPFSRAEISVIHPITRDHPVFSRPSALHHLACHPITHA